jgi:predicted HicB family RNase H-like nuclease
MSPARAAVPKITLRIDVAPPLAEWLRRTADEQGVSRNTLVVAILEAARKEAQDVNA